MSEPPWMRSAVRRYCITVSNCLSRQLYSVARWEIVWVLKQIMVMGIPRGEIHSPGPAVTVVRVDAPTIAVEIELEAEACLLVPAASSATGPLRRSRHALMFSSIALWHCSSSPSRTHLSMRMRSRSCCIQFQGSRQSSMITATVSAIVEGVKRGSKSVVKAGWASGRRCTDKRHKTSFAVLCQHERCGCTR